MSWIEYNDMFERAQEKGEYHLFVFDLKGSRSIGYFMIYYKKHYGLTKPLVIL